MGPPPPAVAIRTFEPGDAAAVSALLATTMRRSNAGDYAPERLEPLIAYFTPAKLVQLAAERTCLVADDGGRVVGTGALDGPALATFFVHPDWQGRGVGTRLLAALEDAARAAGLTRLVVDASVTGAPFYARHGYARTGEVVDGTAGPQIGMAKDLGGAGSPAPPAGTAEPGAGAPAT